MSTTGDNISNHYNQAVLEKSSEEQDHLTRSTKKIKSSTSQVQEEME